MGARERELEIDAGATAQDVVTICRGDAEGGIWTALAVAVNQEYVGRDRVLADGDEVALLPPVSGGSNSMLSFRTYESEEAEEGDGQGAPAQLTRWE